MSELDINIRDSKGNFLDYIPAWNNFMEVGINKFETTATQLLEYNARYKYAIRDDGKDMLTTLVFDTEADKLLFLLRWS